MSNDNQGIPNDIRESVAISSLKSVAEQAAMLSNLAFANLINNTSLSQQNAVSNQQSMNQLNLTLTGKAINRISNLSPTEANATTKIITGNDLASQLAELVAALKNKQ